MLTNLTEVKKLLNLTVTTYDERIETLIPLVIDSVCHYINHYFINRLGYEGTFEYSGNVITTGIGSVDFPAGKDIYIKGTNYNNGFYTVKSIDGGDIYINGIFETETIYSRIWGVNYPKDSFIKKIVAEMIDYNLNPDKYKAVSETLGEASVTFKNDRIINGYPQWIIEKLNDYRKH